LTWTKPEPPAWDAERRFARLLSQIQIVPEGTVSDEQNIIDYILKPDQSDPGQQPQFFQLPALQADEALERIVAAWITEMRPNMHPDLFKTVSNGTADNSAILLTTIDLELERTDANSPWQIQSAEPDNTGRPVLINTQLVQETVLQWQRPITHPFVTVTALSFSPLQLELWFHLNPNYGENDVFIQDASFCFVIVEQGASTQTVNCAVVSGSEQNVFILTPLTSDLSTLTTPPNVSALTPLYLRLVFPVKKLQVQIAPDRSISLRDYAQQQNISYEGYNGNDAIIAYVRVPSSCFSIV
jgi:hypothetical protein